jgi:hypothetical protein
VQKPTRLPRPPERAAHARKEPPAEIDPADPSLYRGHVAFVEKQIAQIDQAVKELIEQSEHLPKVSEAMQQVSGAVEPR